VEEISELRVEFWPHQHHLVFVDVVSREYVFIIFLLTCVCGPFRMRRNGELHNGSTS
jgi:hypothetical protein